MKTTKKFRSKFEEDFSLQLQNDELNYKYEEEILEYIVPERKHKYVPDFVITTKSGKKIYLELKGRLEVADKKKMLLVREQHSDLDIRFIFQNARGRNKGQKSTFGNWADKHGFKYGHKTLPKNWLLE